MRCQAGCDGHWSWQLPMLHCMGVLQKHAAHRHAWASTAELCTAPIRAATCCRHSAAAADFHPLK